MLVKLKNPSLSENRKTYISDDYASGSTLSVESTIGYSNNDFIVVGPIGTEKAELTNLTATPPSDTSFTITALNFSHPKDTLVQLTRWDKFSLEYRTSSSGSWNIYAGMPTDIEWDSLYTEYNDSSATSSYQWRFRLYNSVTAAYSDYSDTLSATGWERGSVGEMISSVRKIVSDAQEDTKDEEIIRFFNDAQQKIYSLYDRWYFLLKTGTVIDTVASTRTYSLPSDFGRMHSVKYNYVAGGTDVSYNLRYIVLPEFDYKIQDNTVQDDDQLTVWTILPSEVLGVCSQMGAAPSTAGLDITPRYYKQFATLDSFGDVTEVPIPEILENYAIAQIYKMRQNEAKADYYDSLFREQVELLKVEQRKTLQSRVFYRWAGRNSDRRLYGERGTYSDQDRINYW